MQHMGTSCTLTVDLQADAIPALPIPAQPHYQTAVKQSPSCMPTAANALWFQSTHIPMRTHKSSWQLWGTAQSCWGALWARPFHAPGWLNMLNSWQLLAALLNQLQVGLVQAQTSVPGPFTCCYCAPLLCRSCGTALYSDTAIAHE